MFRGYRRLIPPLTTLFIILISVVYASTFMYLPNTIVVEGVSPPVRFLDPGTSHVSVDLGANNTSATMRISRNNALHIYDYDAASSIQALRILNTNIFLWLFDIYQINLTQYTFITNVTDLGGGITLLGINITIPTFSGFVTVNGSVKYLGGGTIYLNGDGYYTIDPNVAHTYEINITIRSIPSFIWGFIIYLTIDYYIDGVYVGTALDVNFTPWSYVIVDNIYTGISSSSTARYDLYCDNTTLVDSWGLINLFDDYEDGVDDIYVDTIYSGLTGKEVRLYSFPIISLLSVNDTSLQSYLTYLDADGYAYTGSGLLLQIWLNNGTQTTGKIVFDDGVIFPSQTSMLTHTPGNQVFIYINISAPYSGAPFNLVLNLSYHYSFMDWVEVTYPIKIIYI